MPLSICSQGFWVYIQHGKFMYMILVDYDNKTLIDQSVNVY